MRGTKQVGIWSEMGSFWQPHPTQDQPAPPGGFEIDSRIGAAAPRAPAASKENSHSQAILKLHQPSSLDHLHLNQIEIFDQFIFLYFRLEAGKFDNNLLQSIRSARNFVLVLTPGALDRCMNDDDQR